jgi:hypothetical protein
MLPLENPYVQEVPVVHTQVIKNGDVLRYVGVDGLSVRFSGNGGQTQPQVWIEWQIGDTRGEIGGTIGEVSLGTAFSFSEQELMLGGRKLNRETVNDCPLETKVLRSLAAVVRNEDEKTVALLDEEDPSGVVRWGWQKLAEKVEQVLGNGE